MSIIGFVDSVSRDLRFALRGLSRRPAFTFAAVLTLALGIGATTAIFSVVYSVLIKPLPYPHADELVSVRHVGDRGDIAATRSMYFTYRAENRAFADVGIWQGGSATLTDADGSRRVRSLLVMDGTLQALGVRPARGRWFTAAEHGPAAESSAPVILSHAFWQRQLGGDEAALGSELALETPPSFLGLPAAPSARVVGIMPPDFRFLDMTPQPDVIIPIRLGPAAAPSIGNFEYQTIARLRPGVTLAVANADVARMLAIWSRATATDLRIAPNVRPLKDDLVGSIATTLWVLMGAIGAVLSIACANIANLMLVRADARRHELAVRAALGAGPRRIVRELLVESLVIGGAGGALGLALAYVGLEALVAIGPANLPRLAEIAVHPPVLAFTLTVALASTLLFGSITALKSAAYGGARAIGPARGATASRERNTTRSALVIVQVALALVLVVSAALMIRTFAILRAIDPGFSDPATIQTAAIWIRTGPTIDLAQSASWTRTQHEILDSIAALPGVAATGFASDLPIVSSGTSNTEGFAVEGRPLPRRDERLQANWKSISPGYFAAMGTQLIAGRDVTWNDIDTGGRVVVVSAEFARQIASEPAAALGLRMRLAISPEDDWREVIGVVQSIREVGLYQPPPATVYWPALMANFFGFPEVGNEAVTFAIRSERAGTASLVDDIRRAIRSVDPSVVVAQERTMQDLYTRSLGRTSFTLVMLAIAGVMALALGVVGIYGVIAYVVSQRTREIGIRSALGADPRQLATMFLRHGLTLSAVGVVIGLVGAVALGRAMSSLLFGIEPLDPLAYVTAIGVILATGALATYLPARRAATIDPVETLRAE
jgi:putative ABC transport system permease protein